LSIQAIAWVFEHSESRLGPRHVLLSIANHADQFGRNAWPSVSTIMHETRLSEREVQTSTKMLVELGELSLRKNAGPRGTNVYALVKMPHQKGAK
jgi:hypothetical protein